MQTNVGDDSKGKRFAADSSSSRSVGFVEENVGIGLEGAAASAVNLMQNIRVAAGEMMGVDQSMKFNRRFTVAAPALQFQTGRFLLENSPNCEGSELNSLFGTGNNLLLPEPMNNSYAFPYISHGNVCFPSSAIPNWRSKADDFWNPSSFASFLVHNDSLYPHMTGSYCHDSVFQSSSLPVAAFYQLPRYPVSGRQSYTSYNMDSCDLSIGSSSVATFLTRKQKLVSQSHVCCSTVLDRSKNPSVEMMPMHIWGHRAFGHSSILKQSLNPSLEHPAGCWNLEIFDGFGNDKVVEEGSWTMILRKELRNSDVGSPGRIVLPKREAEANLPPLSERNGVILLMEDMISAVCWEFKYRYWPNNRSRMYIMENTGGFIRSHKLQTGDFFIIYKEEVSGKFIVRGKRGHRSSISANQVEQNCTLQGNMEGVVSAQQPRSNTEMEANLPPSPEPRTFLPTANLLISNAEATATTVGPPYNVESVSGGSTQFTPYFSADTFVNPSDRCLP